ncbi:MAG: alpha-amylase [Anaerolineae bacterium]|nr:alpha-amylase [Anaerolineae bacterium]
MADWASRSIFYHIYPLGFCDAPKRNDFGALPADRLKKIYDWIPHLKQLGVNAIYLGPVFESSTHGYDTADFFTVDRRLGTNSVLTQLIAMLHQNNIRVILDGVFHHVGRDFWAFRDVLKNQQTSAYCDWFSGLDFNQKSPYNDPFAYEGWNGHLDLVKLNLHHSMVKEHLFQAIDMWVQELKIDGLRLDAADAIDKNFLKELAHYCKSRYHDFWLMGEVVHGDYTHWANPEMLDSVTNYECYKGLYSSHVDKNYFEIAYSLNRQFGPRGIYKNLFLYSFVDNHDVNRVASQLTNPAHLYPLYCLLFTMPGIPAIYYGSEWGIEGQKLNGNDTPLRPALDLLTMSHSAPHPGLRQLISKLSRIRLNSAALKFGDYQQLYIAHQLFAFARKSSDNFVVVVVNASERPVSLELTIPNINAAQLCDLLNPGESFSISNRVIQIDPIWPNWARILTEK